jgi:hypothetical protein
MSLNLKAQEVSEYLKLVINALDQKAVTAKELSEKIDNTFLDEKTTETFLNLVNAIQTYPDVHKIDDRYWRG